MEGIEHRVIKANGINMHVAEKGKGPVILFLHGFPELWYTWRHQITAFASLGYRALAPDLRGFGETEAPDDASAYTSLDVVGDLIALLDVVAADQDQVFVVGHDWGALIAWWLCMFRPDRVKALVNMSVAFNPRNPNMKPLEGLRALYGDDYYICRFQEPGVIEAEFRRWDMREHSNKLALMVSEEDCKYYLSQYEKKGFTGGLNYYRNINLYICLPSTSSMNAQNWQLTAPWTGSKIKVPVKFIVGDQDLTYMVRESRITYTREVSRRMFHSWEEVVVMEGVAHFLQEEKPDEVSTGSYMDLGFKSKSKLSRFNNVSQDNETIYRDMPLLFLIFASK
ncbi:hypothetical protein CXB51_025466 [Gossypium anomalum]|uniref:AB hydrolase-1 domain-containing protein n=1 Tax=Gossypium anomalum TaxID=47600 RepID=A0A8J6CRQ3_9ROSI|nr:hypothetical protein CXB51_025466 [Gossypium anomalum]